LRAVCRGGPWHYIMFTVSVAVVDKSTWLSQFHCFVSSLQRWPLTLYHVYCVRGGSGHFSGSQLVSLLCEHFAEAALDTISCLLCQWRQWTNLRDSVSFTALRAVCRGGPWHYIMFTVSVAVVDKSPWLSQFHCFESCLQRWPLTLYHYYCLSGGSEHISVTQSVSLLCEQFAKGARETISCLLCQWRVCTHLRNGVSFNALWVLCRGGPWHYIMFTESVAAVNTSPWSSQFHCFVSSLQRRPLTLYHDYCVSGGSEHISVTQSVSLLCEYFAEAALDIISCLLCQWRQWTLLSITVSLPLDEY
jgi:hypothetical protein